MLLVSLVAIFAALQVTLASEAKAKLLSILGTDEETVATVQSILKEAPEINYTVLETVAKCKSLETAEEIYYSVFHSIGAAETVNSLKALILSLFRAATAPITEDSHAHGLINLCLQHLLILGESRAHYDFDEVFTYLMEIGNTELLEGFLNIGSKIPYMARHSLMASQDPTKVLKLLVAKGINIENFAYYLYRRPEFTADQFETILRDMIQKQPTLIWYAIEADRLDLAHVAYKHGLRLLKSYSASLRPIALRGPAMKLAEYIATKETMETAKLLTMDPNSDFAYLPKELLLNHIAMLLNSVTKEEIYHDMFESSVESDDENDLKDGEVVAYEEDAW